MRIGSPADPTADLTTRARLRQAAIECFAVDGFDVSVRAIAARAGVSAGLVRHHYGSKEALREECDEFVLHTFRALKSQGVEAGPGFVAALLARIDDYSAVLLYMLRSVRDGGPGGLAFLEHMIADAREYSRTAVESGLLRPSHDMEAMVRYLVIEGIGVLIVALTFHPDLTMDNFPAVMGRIMKDITLPRLELFTQGVLTDRSMLEECILYRGDPPDQGAHPPASFP